jgi:hypothetical protein
LQERVKVTLHRYTTGETVTDSETFGPHSASRL